MCLGQNIAKHNFSGNRFSDQLAFLNAFMHCDLSNENCNSIDVDYFNENNLSIFALKTIRNIKVSKRNTTISCCV